MTSHSISPCNNYCTRSTSYPIKVRPACIWSHYIIEPLDLAIRSRGENSPALVIHCGFRHWRIPMFHKNCPRVNIHASWWNSEISVSTFCLLCTIMTRLNCLHRRPVLQTSIMKCLSVRFKFHRFSELDNIKYRTWLQNMSSSFYNNRISFRSVPSAVQA